MRGADRRTWFSGAPLGFGWLVIPRLRFHSRSTALRGRAGTPHERRAQPISVAFLKCLGVTPTCIPGRPGPAGTPLPLAATRSVLRRSSGSRPATARRHRRTGLDAGRAQAPGLIRPESDRLPSPSSSSSSSSRPGGRPRRRRQWRRARARHRASGTEPAVPANPRPASGGTGAVMTRPDGCPRTTRAITQATVLGRRTGPARSTQA